MLWIIDNDCLLVSYIKSRVISINMKQIWCDSLVRVQWMGLYVQSNAGPRRYLLSESKKCEDQQLFDVSNKAFILSDM